MADGMTLYTVQRITKAGKLIGLIHGSDDGETTACNNDQQLDDGWYILTNAFDGKMTCKKCMQIVKETSLIERPVLEDEQ